MPGVLNVTLGFYKLSIKGRYPLRFFILGGAPIRVLYTLYVANIAVFISVVGLVLFILVVAIMFCAPCISRLGWQSRCTIWLYLFRLLGAEFFEGDGEGWIRTWAIAAIVLSLKLLTMVSLFLPLSVYLWLLWWVLLSKKLFSWRKLVSLWNVFFVLRCQNVCPIVLFFACGIIFIYYFVILWAIFILYFVYGSFFLMR